MWVYVRGFIAIIVGLICLVGVLWTIVMFIPCLLIAVGFAKIFHDPDDWFEIARDIVTLPFLFAEKIAKCAGPP